MSKRTIGMSGFTLAEVLITLGIIGVVAAMTMPTLINSTNGAQYKTAYKKALSVMSQAVAMNIALEDFDLSETIAGTNATTNVDATMNAEAQTIYRIFRNRLNVTRIANGSQFNGTAGDAMAYKVVTDKDSADRAAFRTNHSKETAATNNFVTIAAGNVAASGGTSSWPNTATMLFMNDGIALIFDNTQSACHAATANLKDNYCYGFIDVNGQKGPNKVAECDDGSGKGTVGADDYACTVSNPSDIYPIAMYNQTIVPASAAARAILFAK